MPLHTTAFGVTALSPVPPRETGLSTGVLMALFVLILHHRAIPLKIVGTNTKMSTNNAADLPTVAPVTRGGTGRASIPASSVVCGGVGPTDAVQNVSGVGAALDTLTSNGASSLPSWMAAAGSVVLLTTQTASMSSALTFNNTVITPAYTYYMFWLSNIVNDAPATLEMTFSTDNGGTYLASGYLSGTNNPSQTLARPSAAI